MVGKRWTKPLSSSRLTSPHDGVTIGIGSYAENEFPPTIGHDRTECYQALASRLIAISSHAREVSTLFSKSLAKLLLRPK